MENGEARYGRSVCRSGIPELVPPLMPQRFAKLREKILHLRRKTLYKGRIRMYYISVNSNHGDEGRGSRLRHRAGTGENQGGEKPVIMQERDRVVQPGREVVV